MRRSAILAFVPVLSLGIGCGGGEPLARTAVPAIDRDHPPAALSALGLYADPSTKTVSSDFVEFDPAFKLWADGAEKMRWIRLPDGRAIDEADADHWRFPVGTQIFKEFRREGKRLETRVIQRTSDTDDENGYFMASYIWRDDESDADISEKGATTVRGIEHLVPPRDACETCHGGEPGRVLGYSAIQRSKETGSSYVVPGDAKAQAALGYLHANCGHCHNPDGIAFPYNGQVLRLAVDAKTPAETDTVKTTVGIELHRFQTELGATYRIEPGSPEKSGLIQRMMRRDQYGMPAYGSRHVDQDGVAIVADWIRSLESR